MIDALALLRRLPPGIALAVAGGPTLAVSDRAPEATVVFRTAETLDDLVRVPSLLRFGEAFVSGAIDVEGDFEVALQAAYAAESPGADGPTCDSVRRPPDAEAVAFHYDVSDEFFALFLDRRMVYTCAYFSRPGIDLDVAQEAKLDLVCRKLRVGPGHLLLDVGCGWGGLVAWAAGRYGADVLGVTLSPAQARYGARALARTGLADRARVELGHYADVAGEERFDRIAAVGVLEHVGVARYEEYFCRQHALLRPGGLFLNHGITRLPAAGTSTGMEFLARHVFPGIDLPPLSTVIGEMEKVGFRIRDVEALGGHYALTTREWLRRLRTNAPRARALVGERRYRTWVAYLAAATVAFRAGWIDLHQVLAERRHPEARTGPETRADLYRADAVD